MAYEPIDIVDEFVENFINSGDPYDKRLESEYRKAYEKLQKDYGGKNGKNSTSHIMIKNGMIFRKNGFWTDLDGKPIPGSKTFYAINIEF